MPGKRFTARKEVTMTRMNQDDTYFSNRLPLLSNILPTLTHHPPPSLIASILHTKPPPTALKRTITRIYAPCIKPTVIHTPCTGHASVTSLHPYRDRLRRPRWLTSALPSSPFWIIPCPFLRPFCRLRSVLRPPSAWLPRKAYCCHHRNVLRLRNCKFHGFMAECVWV